MDGMDVLVKAGNMIQITPELDRSRKVNLSPSQSTHGVVISLRLLIFCLGIGPISGPLRPSLLTVSR